jgi:hypothetical protein
MSGNIDILKRLPDVAAIGQMKLQDYCNEWLTRPIARDFGISHLIVGADCTRGRKTGWAVVTCSRKAKLLWPKP